MNSEPEDTAVGRILAVAVIVILAGCTGGSMTSTPTDEPAPTTVQQQPTASQLEPVNETLMSVAISMTDPVQRADVMAFDGAGTNVIVIPANGSAETIARSIGVTARLMTYHARNHSVGMVNIDVSDGNEVGMRVQVNQTLIEQYHAGEVSDEEFIEAVMDTATYPNTETTTVGDQGE